MTPERASGSRSRAIAGRRAVAALVAVLLVAGGLLPAVAAEDAQATAQRLQELQARIRELQRGLESDRERKDQLQQALRDTERDIGTAGRRLRDLKAQLADSERRLRRLDADRDREAGQLDTLRRQLARDVRSAYTMGRQERVKLLLNQEDPGTIGRMLTYYRYFATARTERIDAVHSHLAELDRLEADIAAERTRLAGLHDEQARNTADLRERQEDRRALLERVQREMRSKGAELDQLARDEKRLQELVRQLHDLLADIPRSTGAQKPFPDRKGAMDWPVPGRLVAGFGTRRPHSDLTWKGVLIDAPGGAEVRAVSHGRVAFADWLRGFGLLIIIDHGNGYMTLYGHNQSLYKEAGEWVDSGEVIAAVGDTGGQDAAGLYFEVRHNGRPVNPAHWIARR